MKAFNGLGMGCYEMRDSFSEVGIKSLLLSHQNRID